MKRRLIWFVFALVVLPASAQTQQEHEWCSSGAATNDQRIEGCSALIRSARETRPDLAMDYNNRGTAYRGNGLYGLAIADYTEAIALKPDFPDAYSNRGLTNKIRGADDEAIADYTKVIALKPDDAAAYTSRGVVNERKGLRDQAIADYRTALKLDPNQDLAKQSLKQFGVRQAAEKCSFVYSASVRDEIIVPALKRWDTVRGSSKQTLETYYNLSRPDQYYRNSNTLATADGKITLVFDETAIGIDSDELVVVLDPCEHNVVYAEERNSLVVTARRVPKENSDDAVKSGLVGSWIVPGDFWFSAVDDPEKAPANAMRVVESFRADGTGTARLYKDAVCTIPDKSDAFTWNVRNHILAVTAANGGRNDGVLIIGPDKLDVGGIDPNEIVFYSQDHKLEGRFLKASTCGWPANRGALLAAR